MNIAPYFYAIVVYFCLMVIAKIAYTIFVKQTKTIALFSEVKLNWNQNLSQLRESILSYFF